MDHGWVNNRGSQRQWNFDLLNKYNSTNSKRGNGLKHTIDYKHSNISAATLSTEVTNLPDWSEYPGDM